MSNHPFKFDCSCSSPRYVFFDDAGCVQCMQCSKAVLFDCPFCEKYENIVLDDNGIAFCWACFSPVLPEDKNKKYTHNVSSEKCPHHCEFCHYLGICCGDRCKQCRIWPEHKKTKGKYDKRIVNKAIKMKKNFCSRVGVMALVLIFVLFISATSVSAATVASQVTDHSTLTPVNSSIANQNFSTQYLGQGLIGSVPSTVTLWVDATSYTNSDDACVPNSWSGATQFTSCNPHVSISLTADNSIQCPVGSPVGALQNCGMGNKGYSWYGVVAATSSSVHAGAAGKFITYYLYPNTQFGSAYGTTTASTTFSSIPSTYNWNLYIWENASASHSVKIGGTTASSSFPSTILCGKGAVSATSTACGSVSNWYYDLEDTLPSSGYVPGMGTHLIDMLPLSTTTATTSPFHYTIDYYIGDDFSSANFSGLGSNFVPYIGVQFDALENSTSTNLFQMLPIATSTGYHSISTTSPALPNGLMRAEAIFEPTALNIVNNGDLSSCGSYCWLVQTAFVIGQTSLPQSYYNQYFPATSTSPTSITSGLSACDSLLTASGVGCAVGTVMNNALYLLFVPDYSTIQSFTTFETNFKARAPFAYGFILYNDWSNFASTTATSTNPYNLSFTFPAVSGARGTLFNSSSTSAFNGKTLTIIDWSQMASSTNNNYWGTGWNALVTGIDFFMAISFAFWVWSFIQRLRL